MQMRNAARVLPDPVGAEIRTLRPAAISGQPCTCGSVAHSNRASNQSETRGSNPVRGMASSIISWANKRRNRVAKLPVRNGSVRPEVGLGAAGNRLRNLSDLTESFHVDFHAEPGPVIWIELAVLEIETDWNVRWHASFEAVLHQNGSRKCSERVNQRRRRDGSGEMGNDADKMRLADRRDLHHLGDTADVRQRRANIVDVVVLDQLVEVPTITPLFSRCDGHASRCAELRQILRESFGSNGVFDEVRREILDQIAAADRFGEIEALVKIHAPVAIFTDALPRLDAFVIEAVQGRVGVVDGVLG